MEGKKGIKENNSLKLFINFYKKLIHQCNHQGYFNQWLIFKI